MGKGKLTTFDDLTSKTDSLLTDHYVHAKLATFAFTKKQKGGLDITLKGS
jgi:hypothetical protein